MACIPTISDECDNQEINKILQMTTRPRLMSSFSVKPYSSNSRSKPRPTGLWISKRGDFVISDYAEKSVKVFNKMGQLKLQFGEDYLKRPWNVIQLKNGNYTVSDPTDMDVKIFTSQGKFVKTFDFCKNLQEPYGLALNSNGDILAADKGANCIYIQDSDGFTSGIIKSYNNRPLGAWPQYICSTKDDNIIISDYANHCIQCFDKQGNCKFKHGSLGIGKDQLMCPKGVCVDRLGNILVADNANDRIRLLTHNGVAVVDLVSSREGLEGPEAVAINAEEQLVITEGQTGEIKIFSYLA